MREMTGAASTAPRNLAGTVAANVRAEMARHRITGGQLARSIGRTPQWLSRRLTGEIAFGVDELEAVAEALSVPVDRLLRAAA